MSVTLPSFRRFSNDGLTILCFAGDLRMRTFSRRSFNQFLGGNDGAVFERKGDGSIVVDDGVVKEGVPGIVDVLRLGRSLR